MKVNPKLTRLAKVMQLRRKREELRLNLAKAQERKLRAQLDDLQRAHAEISNPGDALCHMSSAMQLSWQAWSERQRLQINLALAGSLAEKEVAAEAAKRAIASEQVVEILLTRRSTRR